MSRWASPASHSFADDSQPVVDDLVPGVGLDLGFAELGGAVEELGDQQVLPLRCQLHETVRRGGRQPAVAHHPERVILLLHQPPYGVKRLLVFEAAIQQLPAELVPAVCAQVAPRVELAEQVSAGVTLELDPQRRRPGRPCQAERLNAVSHQAQLVRQRAADRLPAGPADIQMRGTSPARR
jgi:hypothetical protein